MTLPKDPATKRSWIKGSQHHSWRGGVQDSGNGKLYTVAYDHPQADKRGRVYSHILVAEKALGKFLPLGSVVHHIDKDGHNNVNTNLVICEDQSYHALIHRRERAYKACGFADWLRCQYCKAYDDPRNMYVNPSPRRGPGARHRACHAEAMRKGV